MNTNPQNEHAWGAFCYLAGEMTLAEQLQFEAALADDQSAREALAEAVELTQATSAALAHAPPVASPVAPSPARRMQSRRWSWMALGAAACLLLVIGWQQIAAFYPSPGPSQEAIAAKAVNTRALALRWTEVRQRDGDPWSSELSPSEDWADDEDADTADGGLTDDDFASPVAPEWMLAAAAQIRVNDMMKDGMERVIDPPQEQ